MTRARRELVDLNATSYYHCINRCVRRAFLCGEDDFSGKNYEHRKAWVVDRLTELAPVFAIDICAYAVMSNHYHLVLRIDQKKAAAWSEDQVIHRWQKLFKLPILVERYQKQLTSAAETAVAQQIIEQWRERLMDLSWYMRVLNEYLARKANEEDNCNGRFWEGRYKSQALLDDAAVLTCMSYVDLNPIRAGIVETPESSDFTSIQQRITQWKYTRSETNTHPTQAAVPLMPLVEASKNQHCHAMGYLIDDYLELIDWAGRIVKQGKRGAIPEDAPPILYRLALNPDVYIDHMQGNQKRLTLPNALGRIEKIREYAHQLGVTFIKGYKQSQLLYR